MKSNKQTKLFWVYAIGGVLLSVSAVTFASIRTDPVEVVVAWLLWFFILMAAHTGMAAENEKMKGKR